MTPRRLALLIAALFCLATAVAVAGARYPDDELAVTVDHARAAQQANPLATLASCFEDAPDPDAPCVVVHLHNFAARARLITLGILAAMALSAAAFRRDLDVPRPAAYG